jgi:hypothetical protein
MVTKNSLVFLILFVIVVLGMKVSASIKEHIRKNYPSLWLNLGFPTISPFEFISAKQESGDVTASRRFRLFLRSKERKNLKDTYLDRLVFLSSLLNILSVAFLGLLIFVLIKYGK